MELSDFINGAGNLYGAYAGTKVAEANAETAQAQAKAAAAQAAGQGAMTARTKTIIIYAVGGLIALVLVVFLIKKLK